MIAMQYGFTLPADYDMAIIDRRIRDKGPLLDGLPNLCFKAWLGARAGHRSRDNLYAPFYLWDHPDGLADFLSGPGFAAVSTAFGRPQVRTWIVWEAALSGDLGDAVAATRQILPIEPDAALDTLRRKAKDEAIEDVERGGALAAVTGFDPTDWTHVRFRLWGDAYAPTEAAGVQAYQVGHLSPGASFRREPGRR